MGAPEPAYLESGPARRRHYYHHLAVFYADVRQNGAKKL